MLSSDGMRLLSIRAYGAVAPGANMKIDPGPVSIFPKLVDEIWVLNALVAVAWDEAWRS